MPYYLINELPVFISDSRERDLKTRALGDESAKFHLKSFARSSKEVEKREKRIREFLKALFDEDRERFYKEWVEFQIDGKSASKNVTDLLYDYCQYYSWGTLHDLRDHDERMEQEKMEDAYYYPLGRIFMVSFDRKSGLLRRFLPGSNRGSYRFKVDVDRVYRLKGTLSDFEIHSEDFQLSCSKDVSLIPRSFAFAREQKITWRNHDSIMRLLSGRSTR